MSAAGRTQLIGDTRVPGGFARLIRARAPRCLLFVLAVAAIGGCGDAFEEQEPPAPPTEAELSSFVAETRQPAYWLGPRFRGLAVSHARERRWGVRLTYGAWTCDSGCTDTGGVSTGRRTVGNDLSRAAFGPPGDPKQCWSRVRKAVAVLVGCDPGGYPQELLIYSGTREILVTSLYTRDGQGEISARTVVRGLRPLNTQAAWPLRRPTPFSCHEFSRVDRRYRRHMPRLLRPLREC